MVLIVHLRRLVTFQSTCFRSGHIARRRSPLAKFMSILSLSSLRLPYIPINFSYCKTS